MYKIREVSLCFGYFGDREYIFISYSYNNHILNLQVVNDTPILLIDDKEIIETSQDYFLGLCRWWVCVCENQNDVFFVFNLLKFNELYTWIAIEYRVYLMWISKLLVI